MLNFVYFEGNSTSGREAADLDSFVSRAGAILRKEALEYLLVVSGAFAQFCHGASFPLLPWALAGAQRGITRAAWLPESASVHWPAPGR